MLVFNKTNYKEKYLNINIKDNNRIIELDLLIKL